MAYAAALLLQTAPPRTTAPTARSATTANVLLDQLHVPRLTTAAKDWPASTASVAEPSPSVRLMRNAPFLARFASTSNVRPSHAREILTATPAVPARMVSVSLLLLYALVIKIAKAGLSAATTSLVSLYLLSALAMATVLLARFVPVDSVALAQLPAVARMIAVPARSAQTASVSPVQPLALQPVTAATTSAAPTVNAGPQ